MLSSAPSKASFLNKIISSSVQPARNFASVAFNVKSKFETAFEAKMKTVQNQPKKM